MPLVLPTFTDPLLQSISFCVRTDDPAFSFGNRVSKDAQYGDSFWLHVVRESLPQSRFHFHVDAIRSGDSRPARAKSELEEVLAMASEVSGKETEAWIRATYLIPKDRRPKKGIIPVLSEVSLEVAKETLSLNGARFEFSDGPYDELSWKTRRDGSIELELDAFIGATVDDDCLIDAEVILRTGLKKFVLVDVE
jgi:hypothetical protein